MALSKRTRYRILERDEYTCRYCGANGAGVQLEVDHVIPRSRGGLDATWNLTAACQACNSGKSTIVPSQTIIDAVYAADLADKNQHGLYVPCGWCGKPVDMTGEAEYVAKYDWVDCGPCNATACEAYEEGAKSRRLRLVTN